MQRGPEQLRQPFSPHRRLAGSSFTLDEQQRLGLRSLMKEFGIKQTELHGRINVSQSWISNLLTGVSPTRDIGTFEAFVGELRTAVEVRHFAGRLTDQETAERNELLDEALLQRGLDRSKSIAAPYGPMPIEAANYIHKTREENDLRRIVNNDRRHYQFGAIVVGPPDSGKSTLLGLLEHIAYDDRANVATVNCVDISQTGISPEEEERRVVNGMVQTMVGLWDLPRPRAGEIVDSLDFVLWYGKAMRQANPNERRLFILDSLEDLEHKSLKYKLLHLPERMHQRQVALPAKSAFVSALTPDSPFIQESLQRTWVPKIPVGWFDEDQVADLARKSGGARFGRFGGDLYEQYGGQPFLTNLAIERLTHDEHLDAQQVYEAALQQVSSGEGPFNRHIRNVRKLLKELGDDAGLLISHSQFYRDVGLQLGRSH